MEENFEYAYENARKKAEKFYNNREKFEDLLARAKTLVLDNDLVNDFMEDIKTSIYLLTDWINGNYVDISKESIISILACLIYMMDPFKVLPDNKISQLSKLIVFGFMISLIRGELNKYKEFMLEGGSSSDLIEIPIN